MLDLRRLQMLCEVARTGSLAGAARALSYSTPAVWQQMQRLEAEIGEPLLVTHARGVRLTPAGAVLASHGQQVLRRVRMAEAELAAMRGLEAGELRIAAFTTAAAGLLPDPIKRFRTEHPQVRVTLHESEPAEAVEQLAEGEVDVAVVFTYGGVPDAWAAAALTPVLDEPLYVVMPAHHRLAAERSASIARLCDEDWLRGPHQAAEIVAGDADAVLAADFAYRGRDFGTVQRLVAAGAGVAVVPRLALDELATDVVARPLVGDPGSRRVLAATQRSLAPRAGAQRFVELLADRGQALAQAWREDRASAVATVGEPDAVAVEA